MLEKQFRSVHPIVTSEVTYHSLARTLVIQFKNTLAEHFNPHQFGVLTCGKCKMVVHDV